MVSSPCVGRIWSDPTIPQCICCTTKTCAPWIDECNWLELVVQSCRQGVYADIPHKKEVHLQQILQNGQEGNDLYTGIVSIWRLLAGFFIYYLLW
jgi:hypothetical protein